MTSGKGINDLIITLIKKKVLQKGLFNYGQDIVMAFSPTVVACLVKKRLAKAGVTSTPGPMTRWTIRHILISSSFHLQTSSLAVTNE